MFVPSAHTFGAVATGANTLSPEGMAFLTKEEGVRRQVYDDSSGRTIAGYDDPGLKMNGGKGYPTIGLGLALLTDDLRRRYAPFLKGGRAMTDAELNASIQEAIRPRIAELNRLLTRPVTQNQFDALFSFAYNRGFKGRGFPSALAETNAGNPKAAAAYIAGAAAYETVPHIAARRAREAALYLGSSTGLAAATVATSGWTWLGIAGLGGAAAWWWWGHRRA